MHVAFRADASVAIGHGHVVRCVALSRALRTVGATRTSFLCRNIPHAIGQMLAAHEIEPISMSAASTARYAKDPFALDQRADAQEVLHSLERLTPVDCLVVDHYGLDVEWEGRVRTAVSKLVAIDDLANREHVADVLVDPNLQPTASRYDGLVRHDCRRLLGPRYALLRPEFAVLRGRLDASRARDRVVLFAGGGDPNNVTGHVLRAWSLLSPASRPPLDVVVGSAHVALEEIRVRCESLTGATLHVQTDEMAQLLSEAQLLVGAAGGISWERCCLAVPAIMFAIAANQRSNMALLAAFRTGVALERIEQIEPSVLAETLDRVLKRRGLLRRMSRRAAQLVDGLGATRVALAIASSLGALTLREASASDDVRVWPWRNHPSTRQHFRDPRELGLVEHQAWWRRTLADPSRKLLIAHCGQRDVGVMRFDEAYDGAEVSIYVDPALTGIGLGPEILRAGQRWASDAKRGWRSLQAHILPGNHASESVFAAVGFERRGERWLWETVE